MCNKKKYKIIFYLMTKENNNKEDTTQNYEILKEDYPEYDLSFKIIVIGNSGKKKFYK